ncbi:hypothetical protein ABE85_10955 [Mitsuaria sp. 7]|nr:hypothetical protein ABE85_10955 [Mitsuaria sp. 7]
MKVDAALSGAAPLISDTPKEPTKRESASEDRPPEPPAPWAGLPRPRAPLPSKRRREAWQPSPQALVEERGERRLGVTFGKSLPFPPPKPARAKPSTIDRRASAGLSRALASVEAEVEAPLTFGERVRGTMVRMTARVGALLSRCIGHRGR